MKQCFLFYLQIETRLYLSNAIASKNVDVQFNWKQLNLNHFFAASVSKNVRTFKQRGGIKNTNEMHLLSNSAVFSNKLIAGKWRCSEFDRNLKIKVERLRKRSNYISPSKPPSKHKIRDDLNNEEIADQKSQNLRAIDINAVIDAYSSDNECLTTYYVSPCFGLFGVVIATFIVLMSMVLTCWPQYNVIKQPEYWYQPMLPFMMGFWVLIATKNVVEVSFLTQQSFEKLWRPYAQQIMILSVGHIIIFIIIYIAWVNLLGYHHPMPFTGHAHYISMYLIVYPISIWSLYKLSVKKENESMNKQILGYLLISWFRSFLNILYTKIPALFLMKGTIIQWGLVIFLPILKKLSTWLHEKLSFRITEGNKILASLDAIIAVGCIHSFGMTLILGSQKMNIVAVSLLMLSDFALNTWSFVKILKQRVEATNLSNNERYNSLKCLALKEFLKILIPTVFCLSFAAAYRGSNAELIGNVKGDFWMFKKVDNLEGKFRNIIIFLVIDFLRGLLFGIILWYFRKLSMYNAYCQLLKSCGLLIAVFGSSVINGVLYNL